MHEILPFRKPGPKRIGLTGGIASGKSAAARIFQALGAVVVDADEAARAVVAPGSEVLGAIAEALGPQAIGPDGAMDRAWVGAKVFQDPEARAQLNALVHPAVRVWMGDRQGEAAALKPPAIIPMIPLLFENDLHVGLDEVWLVAAEEGTQRSRIQSRDALDEAAAQARIAAQMSLAEKRARADRVIENHGSFAALGAACGRVWAEAGLPLGWDKGPHPRPTWASPELSGLLAWDRAFHAPEFGGGLSNHLAMSLCARAQLGDTPEGLVAFAEAYAQRLEGDKAFGESLWGLHRHLEQEGPTALSAAVAPQAQGLAGAAFHGLLRLAFGLRANEAGEVAAGLAYLRRCAAELHGGPLPLASDSAEGGLSSLLAAAQRLQQRGAPTFPRDTITPALQQAAKADGFAEAAGGPWPLGPEPVGSLARFGALAYAKADNFVALHMLTGAEAYGWLRPHLPEPEQADQAMAHALLVAYAVLGSPSLEGHEPDQDLPEAQSWTSLCEQALAGQDDHLPKLLVALHHLGESGAGQLLARLAARAALRGEA